MNDIMKKLESIETQLSRMWLHIDFIRTHSATYLGDGVALTHLADETRILVNSYDFGGPMLLINGGRYEEDNLNVLLSFLRDDSVFVDVGANLGFFSIKIGDRLRRHGRVLAFEPHPDLAELAQRNVEINGLADVVTIHNFGLSDVDATLSFTFPKGHLGGGSIGYSDDLARFEVAQCDVRRLDDVLDPYETVDLIKIDIEGHELAAFRGMRRVIARSPRIMILFEKFGTTRTSWAGIRALLTELGLVLYAVGGDATLSPLAAGEFAEFSGYAFATRPGHVDNLNRRRYSIYPSQLAAVGGQRLHPGERLVREGVPEQILFYGPYWYLPAGVWDLHLRGNIVGEIEVVVAERFGYQIDKMRLSGDQRVGRFMTQRDLIKFELIGRPTGGKARIEVDCLELVRIG